MRLQFNQQGLFEATRAAEQWLSDHGFSYGPMQRGKPRGIKHGDIAIAKWSNMTLLEIQQLDGRLVGDGREGPLMIEIKDIAYSHITRQRQAVGE